MFKKVKYTEPALIKNILTYYSTTEYYVFGILIYKTKKIKK